MIARFIRRVLTRLGLVTSPSADMRKAWEARQRDGWPEALQAAVDETRADDRRLLAGNEDLRPPSQLLARGRGPVDAQGLLALSRELGLELDGWQAEVLAAAWDRPLRTPAELAIASRRASKAHAHRVAVEQALAAGEHVHVHDADGVTCKSEVCSPEDLARPGRRLAGMPTTIYDEAWRLSPEDVAAMRAPGSAAAVWSASNARPIGDVARERGIDPPCCPTLGEPGAGDGCQDERHVAHVLAGYGVLEGGGYDYEPAGLVHGKLLDDTRCCLLAELGGLATVFRTTVTCRACSAAMDAIHCDVDPTALQLADGEALLDEVAGMVDEGGRG